VRAGVTTWRTIADLQKLSQRSFSIAGDTFSFRSVSGVADKLNTAPATPFIIYDPDKVPFDATVIEKLYDTEGREYAVEAIEFPNLTLYDVFEEIFVNRCGFDGYDPNGIPNFPVPQLAVGIGETYLDALNQYIEPFGSPNSDGPLFTESNNIISIHDMSQEIPAGFPAPRDLTVFGCSEVSINASFGDVAAAKMVFSVPDTWDFATSRLEVSNLPAGDNLLRLLVKNIFELRSFFQPDLVMDLREQLYWEYLYTLSGGTVSQDVVTKYYDKYAREGTAISERWIPLPGDTYVNPFDDPTETETQHTFYSQHPTKIGRQYQSSIVRETVGKISVDADNPYRGDPFRQELKLAHWAGNHPEGATIENGTLRTVEQQYTPYRNGQVSRKTTDYSHVRELPLAKRNEPAVADISLNGANSRSREMLVTEDGSEYTTGRVVTIHVGPIPLQYAVPLVRRKLRKMTSLQQEATLNIIGYDENIDVGIPFAASDKLYEIEGNFICVGYSGSGEIDANGVATWNMSVEGIEI
jgi:hypothetical protein